MRRLPVVAATGTAMPGGGGIDFAGRDAIALAVELEMLDDGFHRHVKKRGVLQDDEVGQAGKPLTQELGPFYSVWNRSLARHASIIFCLISSTLRCGNLAPRIIAKTDTSIVSGRASSAFSACALISAISSLSFSRSISFSRLRLFLQSCEFFIGNVASDRMTRFRNE